MNSDKDILSLEKQLANILDTLYYMREYAEPELWNRYNFHFGELEAKLAQKELELNSACIQEETLKQEILNSFNDEILNDVESNTTATIENEENTDLLFSKLYRDLVKVLHPDVAESKKKSLSFWHQVKDAKEKNDIERLKTYHDLLICKSEEKRESRIEVLKDKIRYHRNVVDKLKLREPFIYEQSLNNQNWIKQRRSRLLNSILLIDIRLSQKQRMVQALEYKSKAS